MLSVKWSATYQYVFVKLDILEIHFHIVVYKTKLMFMKSLPPVHRAHVEQTLYAGSKTELVLVSARKAILETHTRDAVQNVWSIQIVL